MMIKKYMVLIIGIILLVTSIGCSSEEKNITWTNINAFEIPKYNCIAYGKGIYALAGSDGVISTSTNAKDWNTVSTGTTSGLKYIIWNGENFKAVGDEGVVLTSTNGKKWTLNNTNIKSSFTYLIYKNNRYIAISNNKNEIDISEDGKTWTPCLSNDQFTFEKIVYNGQYFIAVGGDVFSKESNIYLSKDGKTWDSHYVGDYGKFTDIVIDNGVVIASVGFVDSESADGSYRIITSEDLKIWKEITTNPMLITCIDKAKGGYIYAAYNDLYLSKDLVNWTKTKISPEDEYINDFVTCNDNIFAFPDYSNNVYSSKYGSMWDYSVRDHYISFQNIIWYDDQFIAISYALVTRQNVEIFVSADGITWYRRTEKASSLFPIDATAIKDDSTATNGKNYVRVHTKGLLYSNDSSNWNQIVLEADNFLFTGVIWAGERYLAYGSESDGKNGIIYSSLDGIKWTKMMTSTDNQINGIAWNGSKYVAVGYNGTILTYTPKI